MAFLGAKFNQVVPMKGLIWRNRSKLASKLSSTRESSLPGLALARTAGFTLLEVLLVVAIIGILSAIVVYNGIASLNRSRVNSVALNLAGWLNSIHANSTTIASANAQVFCVVDFKFQGTSPALGQASDPSTFRSGDTVFTVTSRVKDNNGNIVDGDARDCSPIEKSFKIPDNLPDRFIITSPTPLIYNLRGNIFVGDPTVNTANNVTGKERTADIKVFIPKGNPRFPNLGYLRCLRINFWLGDISIGDHNPATIGSPCFGDPERGRFTFEGF